MIEMPKNRFHEHMARHPGLTRECVEARLRESTSALEILRRMELFSPFITAWTPFTPFVDGEAISSYKSGRGRS